MTEPTVEGGDRTCPRCGSRLVLETLDGKPPEGAQAVYRSVREGLAYTIWIDRCPSCAGAFFDNGELERGLRDFRFCGEREPEVSEPPPSTAGSSVEVTAPTAVVASKDPATSRAAILLPAREDDDVYDPDDGDSVLGYLARRMNEPWDQRSGVLRASDEGGPISADLPALSTRGEGPATRGLETTGRRLPPGSADGGADTLYAAQFELGVLEESCPKCRQAMIEIPSLAPESRAFRCIDCGGIWLDEVRLRRRES